MSAREPTKVISIRVPAIFFRRLSYLAYHEGKLPSEVAREIMIAYLNLGCVMCGGPIKEWWEIDLPALTATCVNPDCAPDSEGNNIPNYVPVGDFSDPTRRIGSPGFSE